MLFIKEAVAWEWTQTSMILGSLCSLSPIEKAYLSWHNIVDFGLLIVLEALPLRFSNLLFAPFGASRHLHLHPRGGFHFTAGNVLWCPTSPDHFRTLSWGIPGWRTPHERVEHLQGVPSISWTAPIGYLNRISYFVILRSVDHTGGVTQR